MPASMMSAAVGGRWKVIGSSMAMVATGPMPGSTPISVPTMQPSSAYSRFCIETATLIPRTRLESRSISLASEHRAERPEGRRYPTQEGGDETPYGFEHHGTVVRAADVEDADVHSQTDPEDQDAEADQHEDVAGDFADLELIAAQGGDRDERDERRDQ